MTATAEKILSRMLISDRIWIKGVYDSTARAVLLDILTEEPVLCTGDDLRKVHTSVKRFVEAGIHVSHYPGLMEAIDSEILPLIPDGEVTDDEKFEIAEAFDALAWHGLGEDG